MCRYAFSVRQFLLRGSRLALLGAVMLVARDGGADFHDRSTRTAARVCSTPNECLTAPLSSLVDDRPRPHTKVVLPRADGTTRTVSVLDMADQLDTQQDTIDELGQSVQAAMLAIKQLQNQDASFKEKLAVDDSEEEASSKVRLGLRGARYT